MQLVMKPVTALKTMGGRNIQLVFANIEQIFNTHVDFLCQLDECDISEIKSLSDIFISMGDRFMCYIPYCANQLAGNKILSSFGSRPDIKPIIEEATKNILIRVTDISELLRKPVQRIANYPFLIREVIKHTPKDHVDYLELIRAFDRMQLSSSVINDCSKKLEGLQLSSDVQTRFAERINIANLSRFLVREDTIFIVFSNQRKSRKIFLFNDIVILARRDWRDKHHVIEKTPLKDIRISDISESGSSTLLLT